MIHDGSFEESRSGRASPPDVGTMESFRRRLCVLRRGRMAASFSERAVASYVLCA